MEFPVPLLAFAGQREVHVIAADPTFARRDSIFDTSAPSACENKISSSLVQHLASSRYSASRVCAASAHAASFVNPSNTRRCRADGKCFPESFENYPSSHGSSRSREAGTRHLPWQKV